MVDHYCSLTIRYHQWKVVTVSCPFPDSSVIRLQIIRRSEHAEYVIANIRYTSDRKGVRVPATTTDRLNELWRTPQHAYQTTCMDPKSVESSSKTAPISKTERHLFRWAQAQVATFPKREKLTGKPLGRLDSSTWTNFVREYPNPTIFTDTNLARPQDKIVSEFHCTFSRVAFLDYTLFWHHIYPKIVCPKCKSCEHTHARTRMKDHKSKLTQYIRM